MRNTTTQAPEARNGAVPPDGTRRPVMLLGARRCLPGGLLLVLLTLGPAAALAETYEAIDCPDSFSTEARGINDRGDIVGICEDANGRHGFLLRRGGFTTLDPPDSSLTSARGIDDAGRIVAFYVNNNVHGFLLDGRGYRDIDFPGADITTAFGISVTRIVGGYLDANGISHGFVLKKGGYQSIDVPGASWPTASTPWAKS